LPDGIDDGGIERVQDVALVDDGCGSSDDHRFFILIGIPGGQGDNRHEWIVNLDKRRRRHTTEHRKVNVHDDRSGLEFRCQEHGFFAIDGLPDDREVLVQPDVFLMDINMPRMNGIKASNLIKKSWDATVIIGLCAVRDSYTIDAFMRAGASAIVASLFTSI
jgi:CheY-like chemotaxis protein